MIIGLDFDKTYTLDPDFWDGVVIDAIKRGHRVVCVTARVDNEKNRDEVRIPGVEVYFCGMASKAWYMREVQQVPVDVWIDDDPIMCAFGKDETLPIVRKTVTRHRPNANMVWRKH